MKYISHLQQKLKSLKLLIVGDVEAARIFLC